jgi:hypothetical protein
MTAYQDKGANVTREQVAIHEAAHTVMALLRGAPINETSIIQHESGRFEGDSVSLHRYGRSVSVEELSTLVAGLLAGTVAERIAGHDYPIELTPSAIIGEIQRTTAGTGTHWGHDVLQATEIIKASGLTQAIGLLLVSGWMDADKTLRKHWPGVEAIAAELVDRDTLDADDAKRIATEDGCI